MAQALRRTSTPWQYLAFAAGIVLLFGTWTVLYVWFELGTEAMLVPWHCECTWDTRPALGTIARAVNDFFAGPGRSLPAQLFVLVSAGIFAVKSWRAKNRTWLPLTFALANVVLLAAGLVAASLSGAVSDWMVGPRVGIDAGYHRTWYGIAAHLMLWIAFWICLVRLPFGRGASDAMSEGE